MAKADLLAQINALESELTAAGVDYAEIDTSGTNAELEAEIKRLESLLPDEDTSTSTNAQTPDETGQAQESSKRQVVIGKGVNVQIRIDGKKMILESQKPYLLPEDRATQIVADKLGTFGDE